MGGNPTDGAAHGRTPEAGAAPVDESDSGTTSEASSSSDSESVQPVCVNTKETGLVLYRPDEATVRLAREAKERVALAEYAKRVENFMERYKPILVDAVITIGPSLDYYPLTPEDNPKFMLYYLNENFLQHAIRYVAPVSRKIFIFCINEYILPVTKLIKGVTNVPIEIVANEGYDGMGFVLNMLRTRVVCDAFIFLKPELYFREPLEPLVRTFLASGDHIHGWVYQVKPIQPVMLIGDDKRLYVYDRNKLGKGRLGFLLTNELKLKNFYLIRHSVIDKVTIADFGFKRLVIPMLLKKRVVFRVWVSDIFQAGDLEEFSKQLEYKNMFFDGPPEVLFGYGVSVNAQTTLKNSIVGHRCVIERRAVLKDCILMPEVKVEEGSVLIKCIVGTRTVIPKGAKLINCKVANDYVFTEVPNAKDERFSYE